MIRRISDVSSNGISSFKVIQLLTVLCFASNAVIKYPAERLVNAMAAKSVTESILATVYKIAEKSTIKMIWGMVEVDSSVFTKLNIEALCCSYFVGVLSARSRPGLFDSELSGILQHSHRGRV